MQQYLDLLNDIYENGMVRHDRTGTGTRALFARQLKFDLRENFPLITTKKLFIPAIIHELLWFLSGSSNLNYLHQHNITIWDEWADENGDLGPIYGVQWRNWQDAQGNKHDQISQLINDITHHPQSRRLIVSAWNVGELAKMALPPCHAFMQFFVHDGYLSCQLYQRSADIFLGVPFNIASYSLLTAMLAQVCDLKPHEFILTLGDVHLYNNHRDQAIMQLSRAPMALCQLQLNNRVKNIFEFTIDDIKFVNYHAHPSIKAPIAV